jgi:hypothetical protein
MSTNANDNQPQVNVLDPSASELAVKRKRRDRKVKEQITPHDDADVSVTLAASAYGTPQPSPATSEKDLVGDYLAEIMKRHSAMYQETMSSILAFGQSMIEAKGKLLPSDWKLLTESNGFPVEYTVACRYMKIAESPHITNEKNWPRLPLCYNALYEISLLTEAQFEREMELGHIHPEATTRQLHQLRASPRGSASVSKRPRHSELQTNSSKATDEEIKQLESVSVEQNDDTPGKGPENQAVQPTVGNVDANLIDDAQPTEKKKVAEQPTAASDEKNHNRPDGDDPKRRSFRLTVTGENVTRETVRLLQDRIEALLRELAIVGMVIKEVKCSVIS